jgi:predicted RNA-binding Zn-ribbon protein involved in translation (DUF1610 family)
MIRFTCSSCNTSLQASDEDTGREFACPSCGQLQEIPAGSPASRQLSHGSAAQDLEAESEGENALCPRCDATVRVPYELLGTMVCCPYCRADFRARSSNAFEDSDRHYDDYAYPRRRYRRVRIENDDTSSAGATCSLLSVIFGAVAFLFCPIIFGIAGLILGIIGTVLSEDKTMGIIGIVLSVIGPVCGMILLIMVLRAL